jgi:hypothetical protein
MYQSLKIYMVIVCPPTKPNKHMYKVVNATFNNISAISWPSVLFVEENGIPGENH